MMAGTIIDQTVGRQAGQTELRNTPKAQNKEKRVRGRCLLEFTGSLRLCLRRLAMLLCDGHPASATTCSPTLDVLPQYLAVFPGSTACTPWALQLSIARPFRVFRSFNHP